jgi:hypothetical protein
VLLKFLSLIFGNKVSAAARDFSLKDTQLLFALLVLLDWPGRLQ